MRTRFLLLATAVLPLLGGCTNANSETEKADTNIVVQPAKIAPSADAPVAVNPTPEAAVPAGEPVNIVAPPPASIKLSPAAGEITKLVQAGVDSGVILAYVTNSPNTFRLEADEIVYLKDIGMSPALVTAMIQHDQKIREASLAGATVTSPSTPAPGASVWTAGQVSAASNVWQQEAAEPAPAAQQSTATTVPPPPADETPAPETVNYFYDSLSPYGTWIDVDGYGRCWRPTVVVTTPGWRPYSHAGRWMWTDSGWYWYSDYSWGWAPFHYGRWYSHPRWGWCWMPGSTWGPSWVSWRYSDSYCGWAPLPPAAYYAPRVGFTYYGNSCGSSFSFGLTWDYFTFVSYNNFHHHRYDRDSVPHHQAGQVYANTTVVNNIIRGNNNTIINQGIAPTQIAAASGTPIQQVTIRDGRGPRNTHTTRNEQIAHDGQTLSVIRASVPAGHGHTVTGGHMNNTGGAQNLAAGNVTTVAPTAPTVPQSGLIPPPRGGGPQHTVPTRNESSAPATPVVQSSTTATATPPTPPTLSGPRTGGIRPPISGGNTPTAANADTRGENAPGALIIRTPRPPRAQINNAATPPAAAPAASYAAPAAPLTPVPPRNNQSQATPWLNNTPAPAPVQSQQLAEQSGTTRNPPIRHNIRTGNSDTRPTAPSYVAPSVSQSAPSYQSPTPPRVFGAPAPPPPAQSYTPPTRSYETPRSVPAPSAPPSQPSYSPPRHESAPSSSPPPSRSESHSSSSGSSSRGSDSSKSSDNRPSRGR